MGVTKPSSVRILPYNCFPFYLAKGDNAEQKSSVNEIMFIPIVIGMHFQRKTFSSKVRALFCEHYWVIPGGSVLIQPGVTLLCVPA